MRVPRYEAGSGLTPDQLICYQTYHYENDFVYEENGSLPPVECWIVLIVNRTLVDGEPRCYFTINKQGYFMNVTDANDYVRQTMSLYNAQEEGEDYFHGPHDRLDMRRFDGSEENWYGCCTQYKKGNTIQWAFCKNFYPVNEPVLRRQPGEE